MTKPLPFTKAGLCKRIAAIHKAGLKVAAIRPDGTVLVQDGEPAALPPEPSESELRKWEDVEA